MTLVLLVFFAGEWRSDADQKNIQLRNRTIPTERAEKSLLARNDEPVSGLYLIQFVGAIEPGWREQLKQQNVRLLRFVPEDAFVARFAGVRLSAIESLPFVQTFEPYRSTDKVHASLRRPAARGVAPEPLAISTLLSPDASPKELAMVRRMLRQVDKESALRFGNILQGTATPEQLNDLAESPFVLWVEPAPKMRLFDEISTKITGGDDGEVGTPSVTQQLGFDGSGVTIAVADSGLHEGDSTSMHPDLAGRVEAFFHYGTLTDAADEHSHGTHVAGIIAGNAATGEVDEGGSLYGLGVAPGSRLIAQRLFDGDGAYHAPPTFETLTRDAVRAGAEIGSNSWGDDTQGRYDLSAAEFDELVRDADANTAGDQPYILEFSAGNAGPGERTIGTPAVAKNVIASGAVENNRFDLYIYDSGQETMADFSSRGPAEDGRIKPDVVAPGTWIASLRSSLANDDNAWAPISHHYLYQGGTSQSGPHVSGAAAVFVQYYRETVNSATPSPALVKAALINTAIDVEDGFSTGPVPNNDEGWGRVDLTEMIGSSRSFEFIDQTVALTNTQTYEHRILVGSPDEPLKVTLTYTDVPGFPAAIPALVNNLDLEVIAPDGIIYRGNQFDGGESVPNAPSFDIINNVEGVHLFEPVPGEYIIRVHGKHIAEDALRDTEVIDQDFALVVSADIPLPGVGVLFFDKKAYNAPAQLSLRLLDFNLAGQSSIDVLVKSSTENGGETISLTAAGPNGSFTGAVTIVTGPVSEDGILQVSHGDVIDAIYEDAAPAGTRTATARVDLFPPLITNVSVTNRFGRMIVSWQTDEPANATVRFGTNAALTQSATHPRFTFSREVALENTTGGAVYQFLAVSSDEAGNSATNDNDGALFSFVAVPPAAILLVDSYADQLFAVPPLSGYTEALDQVGLDYEIWPTESIGSPTFENLKPFRVVIWRLSEFLFGSAPLTGAEQSALVDYIDYGGSLFIASMEAPSRLDEGGAGAFRSNILQVVNYTEDVGVPFVTGAANDPITSGLEIELDYSVYEDDFKDLFGLPADASDSLQISSNAAPIFYDAFPGQVVGLRYPRIGTDSAGRVVFLSFPLDAVPMNGADPNNRANLLRNVLEFLAPGVEGLGSIAFSSSAYTIPSLVTVEVADSDLVGTGQTTVTIFSDTAGEGQTVLLDETTRPGLFRGFIPLVSPTNNFRPGELRVQHGDTVRAEYFDVSANGIARVDAIVDTVLPVISNITFEPEYEEALVSWTTSKPTDALVQFGESTFLGRTAYDSSYQYDHTLLLTGLQPGRVYHFQVTSRDAAGNVVTNNNNGSLYIFRTLTPFNAPWFDNMEESSSLWVVLDGEPGTSWQLGVPNNGVENEAPSPTKAWGSNLNGEFIDTGDTFLVSPPISLIGGIGATLRFWHSYDFSEQSEFDIYEFGAVFVSTDNGNAWTQIAEYGDFSFGWEEAELNLTSYVGRVVRIGFYYGLFTFDSANHPGWLIDDISVSLSDGPTEFVFKSIEYQDGAAHLRFAAPPGIYVIEGSSNLIQWTPLQTNTATGEEIIFTDVQTTNFPTRYYRLKK